MRLTDADGSRRSATMHGPGCHAVLVLEDGSFYAGRLRGARRECAGEIVFNTSPTGYQEILTDPSYAGQIVVFTAVHLGNYGVNPDDDQATRPRALGLVCRELTGPVRHWRATGALDGWLTERDLPALTDVDTRAVVLHIREAGAMRAAIVPAPPGERAPAREGHIDVASATWLRDALRTAREGPPMQGADWAHRVTCHAPWQAGGDGADRPHVVAVDFGIKRAIVEQLVAAGLRVTVVPCDATPGDVAALRPDGLFLSNGPGDPAAVQGAPELVRAFLGRVPIFGICLGHQIAALACGARTYKLRFGHRGGNHPVRDLDTGQVAITAHNHGFAVDADTLPDVLEPTHINLYDGTLEGLRHREVPLFSVQFHPEAAPGPHEAQPLFARFARQLHGETP